MTQYFDFIFVADDIEKRSFVIVKNALADIYVSGW